MAPINWSILGISLNQWALALALGLASYLVINRVIRFLARKVTALARKTVSRLDEGAAGVFSHTNRLVLLAISILIGVSMLDLPSKWEARLPHLWVIAVGLQVALWLNRGINVWMLEPATKSAPTDPRHRATATTFAFLARMLLWVTVILAILANLGINISAFVASLGIGGVAVAMASQNILADLFASLSIGLDRPFEVGDFIIAGEVLGTVEHIGVKTTRVRSLDGEQVVSSNTELLKRTIRNFKRMSERRVQFGFGITYQTSSKQIAALPAVLRHIVENIGGTRFERAHFKRFGENALEFEVVYHVLDPDYNRYMDIQQRINLELMDACGQQGIAFAHPIRTLQLAPDMRAMDLNSELSVMPLMAGAAR